MNPPLDEPSPASLEASFLLTAFHRMAVIRAFEARSNTKHTACFSKPLHKLHLEYTQLRKAYGLEVEWQGPGSTRQPIAAELPQALPHPNITMKPILTLLTALLGEATFFL